MSNLLSLEDFKGKKLNPNSTPFETLLFVLEVALEKLKDQEKAEAKSNPVSDDLSSEKPQPQKKVVPKKPNPPVRKRRPPSRVKSNPKRKLSNVMSNEEWIEHQKSKKKKKQQEDSSNPVLPEEFEREIIKKCGGSKPGQIVRLIQKTLYETDVSNRHSRLTIPCSQIETFEFLEDSEITQLRQEESIEVSLIHKPARGNEVSLPLTERTLELGQWNLHKGKDDFRKVSPQYVLRAGWNEVVPKAQLRQGNTIQVWAFRDAQNKLCMALVKL